MSLKKRFHFSRRDFLFTGLGSSVGVFIASFANRWMAPALEEGQEDFASLDTRVSGTPWRSLVDDPADLVSGTQFDVLVIGSGYGASTVAARLSENARGTQKICILERGREWSPGDFPQNVGDVVKAVRTPINPLGLLDTNSNLLGDMDVVCASGLGGTSLLNAAIALPPKPGVLARAPWPQEIQQEAADGRMTVYYNRARQVLRPRTDANYATYPKVQALRESMHLEGRDAIPLTLNINYEATTRNANGTPQGACVACGDCCSGCNMGAKNTVQMNYLSIAKNNGVHIHTMVEVQHIEELSNGTYKVTCLNRNKKKSLLPGFMRSSTTLFLYAKKVVVGGGSRGSTEILLRSVKNGNLSVSSALGTRASANGDVLGFSYNGNVRVDGFSQGPQNLGSLPPSSRAGEGIMVAGDYRSQSQTDLEKDVVFLEGCIPSALTSFVAKALATAARPLAQYSQEQTARMDKDLNPTTPLSRDGALGHSTMFLACGHDNSGGRYVLQNNGEAKVVWNNPLSEDSIENIKDQMRNVCQKQESVFIENPWEHFLGRKTIVATHPLGGCPMGDSAQTAVVNHKGQVFKTDGSFHKNLYVVDGSIIPTSLAAPPLLTITAVAERIAEKMLQDARTS